MLNNLPVWFPAWQDLALKSGRALVVALTFEFFVWLAVRWIEKNLREVFAADQHRDPVRRTRRRSKLRGAIRVACRTIAYPVAFLVMLEIFGLPPFLLGVGFLSMAVAMVIAGRRWLEDVVAGFVILSEDQFAVGDEVRIGDIDGIVERMTLRSTWVRDLNEDRLHVFSNRSITTASVPVHSPPGGGPQSLALREEMTGRMLARAGRDE